MKIGDKVVCVNAGFFCHSANTLTEGQSYYVSDASNVGFVRLTGHGDWWYSCGRFKVSEPALSKWDSRFLDLAARVAGWSKDPSTQVGCVIVDSNHRVLGLGYNGFPRGVDDSLERYADRATKLLMVQHAEANAVLNATTSLAGATAYVTHCCCASCAGTLIQAGVTEVVWKEPTTEFYDRNAASYQAAVQMFSESGVTVRKFT